MCMIEKAGDLVKWLREKGRWRRRGRWVAPLRPVMPLRNCVLSRRPSRDFSPLTRLLLKETSNF